MRDSAKNIWHGSVVGDILDNGVAFDIFIEAAKDLCLELQMAAKTTDAYWVPFTEKKKLQTTKSRKSAFAQYSTGLVDGSDDCDNLKKNF